MMPTNKNTQDEFLGPTQISMMKFLCENSYRLIEVIIDFTKGFIIDIWLGTTRLLSENVEGP